MHYYADPVASEGSVDHRSFLGRLDPVDRDFLLGAR